MCLGFHTPAPLSEVTMVTFKFLTQQAAARVGPLLVLVAFAIFTTGTGAAPEIKTLAQQIESIRLKFPGEMAVYMKNLDTGEELALDADRVHETYSVIKIPVMVEVLRRAERGDFALNDRLEFKNSDKRLGSGLLSKMDPGLQPTIRDVLTLMIIVSDNTATDILADKVGRANVTRTMHDLGLKNTSIEFSVLDDYRQWFAYMDPHKHPQTADEIFWFPMDEYSEARVDEASRKLDNDSHIYFGHSTAREVGWLLEKMVHGTYPAL